MLQTQPLYPIRLYRHALSGHSHRIELFLSLLNLPFEQVDVDLAVEQVGDGGPGSQRTAGNVGDEVDTDQDRA